MLSPEQTAGVQEYVFFRTMLQRCAYLTIVTANIMCGGILVKVGYFLEALLTLTALHVLTLPERIPETPHALNASIDATRTSASKLNGFADVEILTRMVTHNGLDKTKKYVDRKVRTSNLKKLRIQPDGHMKVPITRRRESGDTVIGLGGMDAFFTTGAVLKPIGSEDMESVMQLYGISEKDEDTKKKIDLQPASNRPRKQ